MALFIVIVILLISLAVQQYKAGRWRKDRLKESPNYTNTYLDYFGMERDRDTNAPRFISTDLSGDTVMYDKNHNVISNLSKTNETDKFMEHYSEAKANGQRAIELDFLPSEQNKYNFYAKKKYKDISTNANYLVIEGSNDRGMNLAHYYYDYEKRIVVCPSDGFIKRFNDSNLCPVYNTRQIGSNKNLTWDEVLKEISLLQRDIDSNGLDWMQICDADLDYYTYFGKKKRY